MYISTLAALMFLAACNSANDSGTGSDTSMAMDHDSMSMTSDTMPPMEDVPVGAKVYFKNVKDGETVTSPLKVEFGVDGIALDSAGKLRSASGHHHLLIDAGDSIPAGMVIPKDSTHLHFGNAQTSTEIKLLPGKHTLTLQYADGLHRSYGEKLSSTIAVTVK